MTEKKIFFFTVLATALIILIIFFLKSSVKQLANKKPVTPSPTPLTRGRLTLSTKNKLVTENQPLIITVIGDSAQLPIVGYDIDLLYEVQRFDLIAINNLLTNQFDVFSKEKNNGLVITGIKKLGLKQEISLNKTPLVEIKFQPRAVGRFDFSLVKIKSSKKESNLITDANQDILDQVNQITFSVGKLILLTKDKPLTVNKGLVVNLIDFVPEKPGCYDCLAYANLKVDQNGQSRQLSFKIGGFAGLIIDKLTVFNYTFLLNKISTDHVEVTIYEN